MVLDSSCLILPEFTLPLDWEDHAVDCSELLMNDNEDEEFSAASTEVSMIYEQFQMEDQDNNNNNCGDHHQQQQQQEDPHSVMMMMEVDDDDEDNDEPSLLLDSNLLLLDDDEIFHDPCLPPSGGMEYLESISMDDRFSLSLLEEEEPDDDDDDDVLEEEESSSAPDGSATSSTSQQRLHHHHPNVPATTTITTATTTTTAAANTNKDDDPLFEQERYKAMLDRLAESMRRTQETRKSLTIHTSKTRDYCTGERRQSISGVLSSVEKSTSAIQALFDTLT